jgi:hypothetical protein
MERVQIKARARAAAIHLSISMAVAALAAVLVMAVWYPREYGILAGGRTLFWLLVSVDVVMGPLLTFVVFNPRKPRAELVRDLGVIALLQLAALAYGLSIVYQSRPVALVFEVDRFRVVSAADVLTSELPEAQPAYRQLPMWGPWLLGTRDSKPGDERLKAIDLAMQGFDRGQRPSYWQPYDASRGDAIARSRPASVLLKQYPQAAAAIESQLAALRLPLESARFLPMSARADGWIVWLDAAGAVAGFAAFDGFF